MSLIPRWMGKKGFVALLSFTVIFLLLVLLLAVEFRQRNDRTMREIAKLVGYEDYTTFSVSRISSRDPKLFPLKSRKQVDQFLLDNRGRLDITGSEDPDPSSSLQAVLDYDKDFCEVVETSPGREPQGAEESFSGAYDVTGVRSRLVSLLVTARISNGGTQIPFYSVALSANESLNGAGNMLQELLRQSVLREFLKEFRFSYPYDESKLSTDDLETLLEVLERVESPLAAIKGAIRNEILTSIELVFVDRSEYFPAGPIGYLFEPDIHFYLSYQKQLLNDLESIETTGAFTPLGEVPWYAIYTKVLALGEGAMANAVNHSRYTESALDFLKDFLKVQIHQRKFGTPFEGTLSASSKLTTEVKDGVEVPLLKYVGTKPDRSSEAHLTADFILP